MTTAGALNNAYQQNPERFAPVIYIPDVEYSFYLNLDKPTSDPDFDIMKLGLIDGDGNLVATDFAILKQDFQIPGLFYNIYSEFIFPVIGKGYYRFIVYTEDGGDIQIRCTSNIIEVNQALARITSYVAYRNRAARFKFNYGNLPNFYNRFTLIILGIDYQYESDRKQYRNASGSRELRNIRSYRDKLLKLESYYFTLEGHDACSALYEHTEIVINGLNYIAKDGYTIDIKPGQSIKKATINAYEQSPNPKFLPYLEFNTIINQGTPFIDFETIIEKEIKP